MAELCASWWRTKWLVVSVSALILPFDKRARLHERSNLYEDFHKALSTKKLEMYIYIYSRVHRMRPSSYAVYGTVSQSRGRLVTNDQPGRVSRALISSNRRQMDLIRRGWSTVAWLAGLGLGSDAKIVYTRSRAAELNESPSHIFNRCIALFRSRATLFLFVLLGRTLCMPDMHGISAMNTAEKPHWHFEFHRPI